jgi:dTDP-glucose 4,6-dehydratase
MPYNILVTGCAGFIGSNFVHYDLARHLNRKITGLDKLTYAGNIANLSWIPEDQWDRFHFVKGDICDARVVRRLFRDQQIDGIVHFAAESHVDRSIEGPQIFLKTNILGTSVLLDEARKFWMNDDPADHRFVQISTDEVYGSLGAAGFFTESTPLDPHSPYSASKASADLLVSAYHDTFGFPTIITRCSNNYGPYQFPEKLIPLVITRALAHEKLPVYGDGRQVRDWLFVEDHCTAIDCVYELGSPGEVYNIGGNNEKENIDLVRMIISLLRNETGDPAISDDLIRHVTDRPGHDRRYAIDSSKVRQETGWKPCMGFEEGIRRTIRWYIDHSEWIAEVMSGEYRKFFRKNYQSRTRRRE